MTPEPLRLTRRVETPTCAAALMLVPWVACTSNDSTTSSINRAHGLPIRAGEIHGPGTPLRDGFTVPPGAVLAGAALQAEEKVVPGHQPGNEPRPSIPLRSWSAVLGIDGPPLDVIHSFADQAASAGLETVGRGGCTAAQAEPSVPGTPTLPPAPAHCALSTTSPVQGIGVLRGAQITVQIEVLPGRHAIGYVAFYEYGDTRSNPAPPTSSSTLPLPERFRSPPSVSLPAFRGPGTAGSPTLVTSSASTSPRSACSARARWWSRPTASHRAPAHTKHSFRHGRRPRESLPLLPRSREKGQDVSIPRRTAEPLWRLGGSDRLRQRRQRGRQWRYRTTVHPTGPRLHPDLPVPGIGDRRPGLAGTRLPSGIRAAGEPTAGHPGVRQCPQTAAHRRVRRSELRDDGAGGMGDARPVGDDVVRGEPLAGGVANDVWSGASTGSSPSVVLAPEATPISRGKPSFSGTWTVKV